MIDVITPTIRHEGIKIVARCLERQTLQDFRWIVVDHDYDLGWFYESIPKSLWSKTIYLRPKVQKPTRKYKLWNTRNTAYQFVENPLTVEIQDYHWFKSDTLDLFQKCYEDVPKALVSAYYKIVSFKGYDKAMESDDITDSDLEIIDETSSRKLPSIGRFELGPTPYLGYEMNVSSMPTEALNRMTPADENMDNGYLVDTHYFSIQAQCEYRPILVSSEFTVYSFEHKLREPRPKGWRTDCEANQKYLMEKFGGMLERWKQEQIAA